MLCGCVVALGLAAEARADPALDVVAAESLGDEFAGRPVALGLLSDDAAVVGSVTLHESRLMRLDGPASRRLRGEHLEDLAVDPQGDTIVSISDTGLAGFGADLTPLWRVPLPTRQPGEPARRVAVGEAGTIAALVAGDVRTFASDGSPLGTIASDWQIAGLAVFDGANVVVTTGWRSAVACGRSVDAIQLAAHTRTGKVLWRLGDDDAGCDGARGVDVARGEDGQVYVLAAVDGPRHGLRGPPVAFDAYTDTEAASGPFVAYARYTPDGVATQLQHFLMPGPAAVVRPGSIAANILGDVHITGTTTHGLGAADETGTTTPLDAPSGFYLVVASDFADRLVWHEFAADGLTTTVVDLALAGDRAATLVAGAPRPDSSAEGPLVGSSILAWNGGHTAIPAIKRPQRDNVGTFGYESGICGSDPACYCSSDATLSLRMLAPVLLVMLALPRRRRRAGH